MIDYDRFSSDASFITNEDFVGKKIKKMQTETITNTTSKKPFLLSRNSIEEHFRECKIDFTFLNTMGGDKYLYECKLNNSSAKFFIEKHKNILNRTASDRKVKQYITDMENNQWQDNGEPISIDCNFILKNGHHRLLAVSKLKDGISIKFLFVIGISPTVSVFDVGRARSLKDQLVMMDDKILSKYPAYIKALYYLAQNNANFTGGCSNLQVIELAEKYREDILKHKDKFNELKFVNFWAVMIWVTKSYKTESEDFIEKILNGDNLSKNSPELVLRDFLHKKLDKSSSQDRKDIAMYVCHCFLKFLDNDKMPLRASKSAYSKDSYEELKLRMNPPTAQN